MPVVLRVPADVLTKVDQAIKGRRVRIPRHTWLLWLALAIQVQTSSADRAAAAALQRGLLPRRLPDIPGLEFAARYVSGTDVPPYDTILGYAGYQLERATRKLPNLGVNLNERGQVIGVHDGGKTPLELGDLILSIEG